MGSYIDVSVIPSPSSSVIVLLTDFGSPDPVFSLSFLFSFPHGYLE
jgi:hypothetical protein